MLNKSLYIENSSLVNSNIQNISEHPGFYETKKPLRFLWQDAIRESSLSSSVRLVLFCIGFNMTNEGETYGPIGYSLLVRETGLCRRSIINSLRAAEQAGYLQTIKNHDKNGNPSRNSYKAIIPLKTRATDALGQNMLQSKNDENTLDQGITCPTPRATDALPLGQQLPSGQYIQNLQNIKQEKKKKITKEKETSTIENFNHDLSPQIATTQILGNAITDNSPRSVETEKPVLQLEPCGQGSSEKSNSKGNGKNGCKYDTSEERIAKVFDYYTRRTGKKAMMKNRQGKLTASALLVKDLFKKGFTGLDFVGVIDFKTKQWKGDDKMDQYLTPSTLFRKTNFQTYVEQAINAGFISIGEQA